MLHKDNNRKCSVEKKIAGRESQGVCRQDELIGGKPPVVKYVTLTQSISGMGGVICADETEELT
jgi:hypothetical protein